MNTDDKAHYDALTHLPNRFQLDKDLKRELARAEHYDRHLALLYLDIDFLKRINDCYGTDTGDLLLTEAAQRLTKVVRVQDFIAHLGEDNFAVILTEIESTNEISHIAQRIIDEFSRPFQLAGHVALIGISIGIAYYPDTGEDLTELHKSAEIALRSAKEFGRSNFQYYTEALSERRDK